MKTLPIKKAACTIGLQKCGKVWVFTDDVQVYSLQQYTIGKEISKVNMLLSKTMFGHVSNVSSMDICPQVQTPSPHPI